MSAFCKDCQREVSVKSHRDGDGPGDGIHDREWTVHECAECGSECLFTDEACDVEYDGDGSLYDPIGDEAI